MSNEKKEKNKKDKKKKEFGFRKLKRKIISFSKLLIACLTYKIFLLIIAVCICLAIFSNYKSDVQKKINSSAKKNITSLVDESLEKINLKINDEFTVLNTLAVIYNCNEEENIAEIENYYSEILEVHSFVGINLLTKDKESIVSLGTNVEFNAEDFYEEILEGKKAISPAVFDEVNKEEYIYLGVPVYENDKVIGILSCNYKIDDITEIIDTSSFGKFGTTFISQEDGVLVARPENVKNNTNLFELLDTIDIDNDDSIKKLKKNIKKGNSGIITYGEGKHKRYICYDVIPGTDWYAVSIVSADVINPLADKVANLAMSLSISISFVFIIYIIITLGIDIQMLRKKRNEERNNVS